MPLTCEIDQEAELQIDSYLTVQDTFYQPVDANDLAEISCWSDAVYYRMLPVLTCLHDAACMDVFTGCCLYGRG